MKLIIIILICTALNMAAQDYGDLIFEDNFNRNDSSETKETLGNGWTSNSDKRAKGNKQLFLKDGALFISTHSEADHAAIAFHDCGFKDGTISMKVKFTNSKQAINFNIADFKEKSVWAGHLMALEVRPYRIGFKDLKTGSMNLTLREARKSGVLTHEQKKLLASKNKKIKNELALSQWHEVVATINGDELSCTVNGNYVGSFKSPGINHPKKATLRLIVSNDITVDDLKIWKKN